ncbi:MAG: hypothetical protein Q7S95_00210 [bacterium]|nr:hypothetical protein [bacterium]
MAASSSQRNRCPPLPTICPECEHKIKGVVFWDRLYKEPIERTSKTGQPYTAWVILGLCSALCRDTRRERLLAPARERERGKPHP